MKHLKTNRAFTLIELLVVIGIIGILAAILLPAIKAALDKANKAQAANEVTGLANAIKQFYAEYNRYPDPGANTADKTFTAAESKTLVEILTATEPAGTKKNSRNIPFLELASTSTNSAGNFIDPWDNAYVVAIDFGFDNKITGTPQGDIGGRGVAVWSLGPDGVVKTADDIKSW